MWYNLIKSWKNLGWINPFKQNKHQNLCHWDKKLERVKMKESNCLKMSFYLFVFYFQSEKLQNPMVCYSRERLVVDTWLAASRARRRRIAEPVEEESRAPRVESVPHTRCKTRTEKGTSGPVTHTVPILRFSQLLPSVGECGKLQESW